MKKHILCFGDSNTHGYYAETNGRFDEEHRWTQLLQKKLGTGYLVIEEGLSGRTTCFNDPIHEGMSGLDYICPCLKSHEPIDLLIIMLGTNDTKERFGASAECIAIGMGRLIKKAVSVEECWRGGRPNILLVTPQNIGREYAHTACASTMGRGCAEKSEGLSEEYKTLAAQLGCHYLDANSVVTDGPNCVDFMHLTAEGHRQLAEALALEVGRLVGDDLKK